MGRFDNQVAVVIGGARGIGLATVKRFLAEGATVVAGDIIEPVEETGASFHQLDAADPGAMEDFASAVMEEHRRLDVLFNNVGVHSSVSVPESDPDEFDRVMRINAKSHYLACRSFLPGMVGRRSGAIVNMSSHGGIAGRPNDPIYNMSKHAIAGLTRSLAVTYAHLGIRVNAVAPGAIDTPMLRAAIPDDVPIDDLMGAMTANIPAARIGQPEEVAAVVAFLASGDAAYVTGHVIPIDGGRTAGVMPSNRYRTDHLDQ